MNKPPYQPGSAADLAASLTDEYNQATRTEAEDATGNLQAFIDSVPDKTEFTSSPRVKYVLPIAALVMALLAWAVLRDMGGVHRPGDKGGVGALIFCLVGVAILVAATWANRHSGTFVFMTLDHRCLRVHNLQQPIDLLQVGRVSYKNGRWMESLILELGSDSGENSHQRKVSFEFSKALFTRSRGTPKVRIMSVGYRVNGKPLRDDELLGVMESYLNVARAEQELAALRQRQMGFV
ncbi:MULTISPECIES: hypothetical protein [unclassified Pseudomonas]|uniref:hypothetical protein n=1 Tax=unclassified Pseudomonas TaxID=196821 RepID=UPI000812A138|nr:MULTISPECIES: hypothetical protein [unclassified Pseudomonas]CRM49645.1 hypothetical protein [Pseudomonas sp. 37 R 15]